MIEKCTRRVCSVIAISLVMLAGFPLAGQQAQVAIKLEFENEHVRVERVTIPPGYKSPAMHTHERPSLEIFLTDDHIAEILPDGTRREWRAKANEVAWISATTHRVENLRTAPTEIIAIEFKSLPPAAAKAGDSHAAETFENEWIKVTHGRIAPGARGAQHTHPNYIGVFLTDTKLRVHLPDGSTREMNGKRGDVSWRAPVTHSVENLAATPFEAVDVNLKFPNAPR